MIDLILVAVLVAVVIAAGSYVYRAKKRGAKCIGCPMEGGCCGCSGKSEH
jgi:hypothetical protein